MLTISKNKSERDKERGANIKQNTIYIIIYTFLFSDGNQGGGDENHCEDGESDGMVTIGPLQINVSFPDSTVT